MADECQATNAQGEPCGMSPLTDSDFCWAHDPQRARERAEARKKGGYNRRRPKATEAPDDVEIRDVDAVLGVLEGAIADTLLLENSVKRSRALGYLAGQALSALEVGEMEERLAALEEVVGNLRMRGVA